MARARSTRLARLGAKAEHADSAAHIDRCALGGLDAVCALVRDKLVQAAIDPERAAILRIVASPDPLPDDGRSGEPAAFSLTDRDSLAATFAEKIGQLAGRFEGGQEPDFTNASLAELLAWCFVQGSPPAKDEV